jgi:hypothetical protein
MTTLRDAILAAIRLSPRKDHEVQRRDLFDDTPARNGRKRS